MKKGDKLDLVLTKAENGALAVKLDDAGPALALVKPQEGKPLPKDAVLVKAMPCLSQPGRLHAEVVYAPDPPPQAKPEPKRAGPARVSNTKYRSGWDHVFGDKTLN